MSDPAAAHAFLVGEVEALEPFDFVAVVPDGNPQHITEVTRREDGELEVRVPGRPRVLPPLEAPARAALAERGFASEAPEDPTLPWVHPAGDAAAAVTLLQDVLVGVFGGKRDARLDIGHGSHRAEHEARQKLAVARGRIERIATDILGRRPERDGDDDFVLPVGEVHVTVSPRATPDGPVVIRVFAITNSGVQITPELGLMLSRLNFGLMFGRFALDVENRSIWFDEALLGEQFREEELRFAVRTVARIADEWDDRLKQMFGGATYQEVLAGRSTQSPPPLKPGDEGPGQYL